MRPTPEEIRRDAEEEAQREMAMQEYRDAHFDYLEASFKAMNQTVNIEGLDKAELLAALYNAAKLSPMLDPAKMQMSKEMAAIEIENNSSMYFDYLKLKCLKIGIKGNELKTGLYDRDNGRGAGEAVVQKLRENL